MRLRRLQPIHIIRAALPAPASGTYGFQVCSYVAFAINKGIEWVTRQEGEMADGNSCGRTALFQICRSSRVCSALVAPHHFWTCFFNISPKLHHCRNSEILLLSALFWQSVTAKLTQQSNDSGADSRAGSCVSCAQLLWQGNSHQEEQVDCYSIQLKTELAHCLLIRGKHNVVGERPNPFLGVCQMFLHCLSNCPSIPVLFLINAAFGGNEERGCKSVGARVGGDLPRHVLHSVFQVRERDFFSSYSILVMKFWVLYMLSDRY